MPKSKRKKRSNKTGYFGLVKLSSGRYRAQIWIDGTMKNFVTDHSKVFSRLAWQRKSHKHYVSKSLANTLTYWTSRLKKLDPGERPIHHNNTVGYRGVSKKGKNFRARIEIGGKQKYIGIYDTAKEAAVAYDRAILKANLSTTLLNFPDMVHNLDVEPKPKRKKRKKASTTTKSSISKAMMEGSELLFALATKQT